MLGARGVVDILPCMSRRNMLSSQSSSVTRSLVDILRVALSRAVWCTSFCWYVFSLESVVPMRNCLSSGVIWFAALAGCLISWVLLISVTNRSMLLFVEVLDLLSARLVWGVCDTTNGVKFVLSMVSAASMFSTSYLFVVGG